VLGGISGGICCSGGNEMKEKKLSSFIIVRCRPPPALPTIMASVSSFPVTSIQPNKIGNYLFPYHHSSETIPFTFALPFCGTKHQVAFTTT
jgi:hypothetical protein